MRPAKLSLFAPIALALSLSAQAGTFSAGTLSTTPFFAAHSVSGLFSDVYNFEISASNPITAASAVPLTLPIPGGSGNLYDIANFSAQLFASGNTLVGSLAFDPFLQDFTLQVTLSPGSYHVDVKGTGDGLAGGFYSLALAAVPEPGAWAMMLVGIAAVGLTFRRQRQ
jgi:hypothetical protein